MGSIETIASCVTTVGFLALLTTWYLLPKWRTLHNFIGLQQILSGTVHLYMMAIPRLVAIVPFSLFAYLFINTLIWSLCASLFAYLKLSLVSVQRISHEKTKAFLFAYGGTALVPVVAQWLVPRLLCLGGSDGLVVRRLCQELSGMQCIYLIVTANVVLFVSVTKSVLGSGRPSLSEKCKRLIPLIGVALLCDMLTATMLLTIIPNLILSRDETFVPQIIFSFRFILQCIVLLLNRRTRTLYVEYWERKQRNNCTI